MKLLLIIFVLVSASLFAQDDIKLINDRANTLAFRTDKPSLSFNIYDKYGNAATNKVALIEQGKIKIIMTVEKDSVKIEELAKLINDIQALEKKWKFDIKIEFTKEQEKKLNWNGFYLNNQ